MRLCKQDLPFTTHGDMSKLTAKTLSHTHTYMHGSNNLQVNQLQAINPISLQPVSIMANKILCKLL